MIAWYWILVTAIIMNFLTVLFSNKIDFETFWEEFISILFYPLIWLGIFPYVFFRGLVRPVSQQRFKETSTSFLFDTSKIKLTETVRKRTVSFFTF